MKLFFVGGPNQRKDYHIECGEEVSMSVVHGIQAIGLALLRSCTHVRRDRHVHVL